MNHLFRLTIIIMLVSSLVSYAQYPDNFQFIKVPDPLSGTNPPYSLSSKELPELGIPFFDASFGTMLTRATDANSIHGRHEYSRFDPFNKDQSMIVLDPDVLWNVYSTKSFPYNHPDNLIMTINLEEPRWDPDDQNIIWGTDEFTIKRINVSTGETTLIKDFSQDPVISPIIDQGNVYRITMQDEGESSLDKRYWAFFLQGNEQTEYEHLYIFTWDRIADSVLGLYKIPENERKLDWIGMSPLGNWVLIGGDYDNGGNLAGLTMANKELTQFHRLDYTTAHSDVALDVAGNEVIVMQNTMTDYIDLIPIDLKTQPVLEAGGSYENTNRTQLLRLFYTNESPLGMNSGIHISCNVPGYCVVSTFIEPDLPEQNWLDRTIILVKLDAVNSQAWYLAKLYTTAGSYWEETQATISNDGTKIVWSSNWGWNVGNGQVFLMQLDMPSNWKDKITSISNTPEENVLRFQLNQNFPNPFNPSTTISFRLPKPGWVMLFVHDVLGNEVETLINEYKTAGVHKINFVANDLANGVYFYKIRIGKYWAETKKMILLK
jgi:hypothetical protein